MSAKGVNEVIDAVISDNYGGVPLGLTDGLAEAIIAAVRDDPTIVGLVLDHTPLRSGVRVPLYRFKETS